MKRFLAGVAKLVLLVFLFYYIVQTGFLSHVALPALERFVTFIEPDEVNQNIASEDSGIAESIQPPPANESSRDFIFSPLFPPDDVDVAAIRQTIFDLTNELRAEHGAGSVIQNVVLQEAADVRAVESEESFSHTRPNGSEFQTVLSENGLAYDYVLVGENLAMATHHLSDTEMANFLFDGWVDSPGHFENMIEPRYLEIGIGVHYDGEFLYLVQIFGTGYQ